MRNHIIRYSDMLCVRKFVFVLFCSARLQINKIICNNLIKMCHHHALVIMVFHH